MQYNFVSFSMLISIIVAPSSMQYSVHVGIYVCNVYSRK